MIITYQIRKYGMQRKCPIWILSSFLPLTKALRYASVNTGGGGEIKL